MRTRPLPSLAGLSGWLGLAALLGLAACAGAPLQPESATPAEPLQLASGVYLFPGDVGMADADNRGRIGNAGFIVGETGVLVIDTGTSREHGRALLAAIRRVTDKPVRLALVTHVRPEFLFGAAAMRERGIPVAMHERSAGLMTSRCELCLRDLRRVVGEQEMNGTTTFQPDQVFSGAHRVDTIGRPVQVLYFGHSSGPGDIAVYEEQTGVLFAGGLLDNRRIPDIQDADPAGWRQALAALRGLQARIVVPGHGPAASTTLVGQIERYLDQLDARARALAEAGTSLADVPDAAGLPDYRDWAQYDTIHPRNATIAFLRFEREAFVR
jgi:glyoxylase-like metal-dependent hydrolase (beta-lactamase superfamily II)